MRHVCVFFVASVACVQSPPPREGATLEVPTIAIKRADTAPAAPKVEPQPDVPDAYSWTDERVIERLTADCRWRPLNLDKQKENSRQPLSCVLDLRPGLSHPCYEEYEDECKPGCTKTCHGCTSVCVTQCETCKSTCTDDACHRVCAETCASCRQQCVQEVNACQATACSERFRECAAALMNDMKKAGCKKACEQAYYCSRRCELTTGAESCFDACRKTFDYKCSDRFYGYCASGGS
ncbi:MAG: hypothetical protein KIT84_08490 [Labilithrix sp.]|nr:hypothetical protein [Labilithrix sp.]MCW5811036.1 hypothetical protein [Labilithrix sp.]